MGNIFARTRDVTVVGAGRSSLDPIARAVAAIRGRVVKPAQLRDRGYDDRSDPLSLAKISVPALATARTSSATRPGGDGGRSRTGS